MRKMPLGNTSLEVTQLGFGAAELRGPGFYRGMDVTEAQCETILNTVLDAGINFIDTSDDYGLSEERIGRYISHRRDDYFLATKTGFDPKGKVKRWWPPRNLTRDHMWRGLERSLKRMRTEYVDILQFHDPEPQDVLDNGALDTMREMREQGLIRFIGMSNGKGRLGEFFQIGGFDTYQIGFSCMEMHNRQIMERIGASGAGVIVRGAVAKGGPQNLVSHYSSRGKKRKTPRPPMPDLWNLAEMDQLLADCETPAELILHHVLSTPHCHTAIVGMIYPEHVEKNLAVANRPPMDPQLYEEINRRMLIAREKYWVPWREEMRRLREQRETQKS